MRATIRKLLFFVVVIAGTLQLATQTHAQQQNAITVTPAFASVELQTGTTEAETVIDVTNGFASTITLDVALKGIDQISGQLLPTETVDPQLAQAARFSAQELVLSAGETKKLSLFVTNIEGLEPGGHYATIVLTERVNAAATGSLRSAISISAFVVKRGGEKEELNFTGLSADGSLFSLPKRAVVGLGNTGNVHTVARGVVSVSKDTDTLRKGVLNESALPLLPGKEAVFTVPLLSLKSAPLMPARISINVEYRPDQSSAVVRQTISRWYVPAPLVIAAGSTVVLVAAGMVFLKKRGRARRHDTPSAERQPDGAVPIRVRRVKKVTVKDLDDD